jgi:hypothetical protein
MLSFFIFAIGFSLGALFMAGLAYCRDENLDTDRQKNVIKEAIYLHKHAPQHITTAKPQKQTSPETIEA